LFSGRYYEDLSLRREISEVEEEKEEEKKVEEPAAELEAKLPRGLDAEALLREAEAQLGNDQVRRHAQKGNMISSFFRSKRCMTL
jgi:hypothetical protein